MTRFLVEVEATDLIEVRDVDTPEEALEAAKDIFSPVTCDSISVRVIKKFKDDEEV